VKVHIKSFQSIDDVSFEIPEKSFTCIVGPSNIGKSALRRALECLIYNKSEASFIRNGTKTCSVEITFDDGTIIKWYRNKKTAGYVINGVDFTKLAGSVPEILVDKGYKELIVNKDKYQVQVASQFNNIFLLKETGGKVTEVLSNLGNLNRIIKSNKFCQTDLKSNKSRLKLRREDITLAKEKIKSYMGLDEQRFLVDSLKTHLRSIKDIKENCDRLKKVDKSLNHSIRVVKALRPVRKIDVVPFDLDINKLTNLKNLLKKLDHSQKMIKDYAPISTVKNVELNISVDILITLKNLLSKYSVYESKQQHYAKLSETKDIEFNLKEEYDKYTQINDHLRKLNKVKKKVELYKNLPETVPVLGDFDISKFEKLNTLYKKVQVAKKAVLSLREKTKDVEKKLIKLEDEKEIIQKTLRVCPLCDKEF